MHNEDWHRADIKAELEKAGWSLRRLSIHNGYVGGSLRQALEKPWPKAEAIIAKAIGVAPETIWPSRYDSKLRPNRRGVRVTLENRSRIHDTESGQERNGNR